MKAKKSNQFDKLQELDDLIAKNEARHQALRKIRRYSIRMRTEQIGAKEIEHVVELDAATQRHVETASKVQEEQSETPILKGSGPSQTILNRLIELSIAELEESAGQIFSMLPVREFRSVFGTHVKSVTMITDKSGKISLFDIEGHSLAELTVNTTISRNGTEVPPFAPAVIIKPSHMNDMVCGVLSSNGRLDGFRLFVEDSDKSQRKIHLLHDWAVNI